MKTKLLIVSWYGINCVGGVERVTQYMSNAWKEKYDITIIDMRYIRKNFIMAKLLTGMHSVTDSIIMSYCINKICRKYKHNNILFKCVTQGHSAPFVKADIAFAHGTMRGYKIAIEGKKAKWKFNQLFEKICFQNSGQVVAVSKRVANEVNQLYKIPLNKICILDNCVDTDFFTPSYATGKKDKYNIIFAGRLEQRKGIDKLLKLAQRIERIDEFELHIATPNTQNMEIFRNFTHTTVRHGLNKSEMRDFYRSGDLMFFPSLYEGFEMVTTECLSCGVPVIGNKVGAIGDLYEKGLEGVYLLPKKNEISYEYLTHICHKFRKKSNKQILHNNMEQFYSEKVYKERLQKLF